MAANVQELFQIKNRILGVLILEARQASGLKAADCAGMLGISEAQFSAFESGQNSPTLPQLELLAFAFKVPIKHFWGAESLSAERHLDDLKARAPDLLTIRQKIMGLTMRQLREKNGMSTAQLAEKSGIAADRIEGVEQGTLEMPISELEVLTRAAGGVLDDLIDEHGPVGTWLQAQEEFEAFTKLSPQLRAFILRPINKSYIELAMKLSEMKVDQLRSIAEGILEITF